MQEHAFVCVQENVQNKEKFQAWSKINIFYL